MMGVIAHDTQHPLWTLSLGRVAVEDKYIVGEHLVDDFGSWTWDAGAISWLEVLPLDPCLAISEVVFHYD